MSPHLGSRTMRALAQLPGLEQLDVSHSGVTGGALGELVQAGLLEKLAIQHCQRLTGACFDALARVPSLRWVTAVESGVISSKALARFEEKRPDCCVQRPDRTFNWSWDEIIGSYA